MLEHKEHIIRLFNKGVLGTESAEWFYKNGFAIICSGGNVIDIVTDTI